MATRQAAVQWIAGRQMVRHRLLPLTASHTVFPAVSTSSQLSLRLIDYGPQLQQPASRWAVPVTSLARRDDVTLVAMPPRADSERSMASVVADSQMSLRRLALSQYHGKKWVIGSTRTGNRIQPIP